MQCWIISQFPEDRQMWSEDDRLDQQRVPRESLKEPAGSGRRPDNRNAPVKEGSVYRNYCTFIIDILK